MIYVTYASGNQTIFRCMAITCTIFSCLGNGWLPAVNK